MAANRAVTELLGDWRSGDDHALNLLTPLVYDELRTLAHRYMQRERAGHTLQATGLVNEAFVRLVGMDVSWQDRAHFFAVASRLMRRILIDYAKAHRSRKRGAGAVPATFYEEEIEGATAPDDLLAIDEALARLEAMDARKSDVLVLHYFGGLTYEEIAEALGISAATVDRDLRLGKAWLLHEITDA